MDLTEEMKDLYFEKYKTLIKEIENDTNGKTSCVHGSEELIMLKCPYCSKQSTDSMQTLSKYQQQFS